MTALAPGTRLGPYEVREPIGAGGMGEVYKASDTRLERIVAIKALPRHFAANPEMRQRFEREAQALASLNHPHICVLHDIGAQGETNYLVMEYLEGETLTARLERGPVAVDEALKMGIEIADALDKAHRRGIVHRDLKPSNVMLTPSGTKLLDFGLAKWATAPPTASSSVSQSPTGLPTGKDLTSPGTVLGTLQYMAPEQLEGLDADARTDIFAFGALLHEMITGKKAFEGKSRVLLMSAIATSHPPALSTLEPGATRALDHVVQTCLAKEPADRWQTARDVLAELEWVAAGGDSATPAAPPSWAHERPWPFRVGLAAAGLLTGAAVAGAGIYAMRSPTGSDELRFRVPIQLTAETRTAGGTNATNTSGVGAYGVSGPGVFNPANFAISPNGETLAFVARQTNAAGTSWILYVRPVGVTTPQRLAGTEGAERPFWSADGKSIGFVTAGKLKRIDATGGPPQDICDAAGFFGGAWNADGVILFGSAQGIQRVPAEGGKPELLTKVTDTQAGHYWPHFLPDGQRFLYTVWSPQTANRAVLVGSLAAESAAAAPVLPLASNAGYVEPGYIVFHRENAVYAQPFDKNSLKVSGEPTRIANEVSFEGGNGRGNFSVAAGGTLAYFFDTVGGATQTGPQSDLSEYQLSWISRTAQLLKPVGPPGAYRGVEAFTKTDRVAVHRHDANGGDVVIFEPTTANLRLTVDAKQHNSTPIWSPDGKDIAFASLRNGKWGLYKKLSSGSGAEELLHESDLPKAPTSWSPDGKRLVFWVQDAANAGDLWVLNLEDKKAEKLIATPFNETHGQISPDGAWIAFTDNSKDNKNEIYVQPFPAGAGKFQISDNGGDQPRWRGDSKEIFYASLGPPANPGVSFGSNTNPGVLFSVAVRANGPAFEKEGLPRQTLGFLQVKLPHSGGSYFFYAVAPDGQRFLVPQYFPPAAGGGGSAGPIGPDTFSGLTVAINWPSSVK